MTVTFGSSPVLLVIALLLAAGATWWSYRTTVPDVGTARRWMLGGLRFVALALVLFLLFEPLVSREKSARVQPVVGLLIDASESMTFSDSTSASPVADIVDRVRRALGNERVRVFSFGADVQPVDSLDTLTFDGGRTDIARALSGVEDAMQGETLGSVVLLSDGVHNTGSNPLHVAERYPVPIVAVAHGDSTVRRDVRIVQIITNELVYAGSEVPVRVRVRNDGFAATPVTVTLEQNGTVLDRSTLELPADAGEVVTDLVFTARTPGLVRLQVNVSGLDGEATYRNNAETVSIRVLDQRRQILLVAGAASPDVAAWRQAWRADEDIELVTRVQKAPGQYFEGVLPDTLNRFDLLILAGFPGTATDPADSRRLADAVSNGLPVLYFEDHAADLRMLQRDWAGLLPVAPQSIRTSWVAGAFVSTPQAAGHAIFDTGMRRDDGMWRRLPPLRTGETTWTVSPGADVLAVRAIRGIELPDPLLVAGRTGRGRSAAILAHGMWRWSNLPPDLSEEAATWSAIRQNMLQWLFAGDDERLVRVEPAATIFQEGESVILRGEVYDEALRPLADASVTVTLRAPDGTDVPLGMQALGAGRYVVDAGSLPPGAYAYSARAERNGAELGSDAGEFLVGSQSLEFRRTQADFRLLDQLAARSGGTRIAESGLDQLPAILAALPSQAPTERIETSQQRVWQWMPMLALVLLLLTLEWFFRKRFGMV